MNGFQIISAEETISPKNLFVVLFGDPGVGKTTLSFTMPSPVLHLDFDNGVERADQKIRPTTIKVNDYGKFHDWVMSDDFEAFVESHGIKSVNIDTIGTLLDNYMAGWLIKQDPKNGTSTGALSLGGWGALAVTFNLLIARFQKLGLEVGAVCHAKEEGDGTDRKIGLAVKGGSTDIIYRSCDMMGYVFMKGTNRMIEFSPNGLHVGKNVAGLDTLKVPNTDTDQYDTFLADKVVAACRAKMTQASQKQVEFKARLDEFKGIMADCEFTGDFEAAKAWVAEQHGTLQAQAGKMLEDAVASSWNAQLEACRKPEEMNNFIESFKSEQSNYIKAKIKPLITARLNALQMKFDKETQKVVYIETVAE